MAGRKKKGTDQQPLDESMCGCGHKKEDHVQTGQGAKRRTVCFNFGCECHREWKKEEKKEEVAA